MAIKNNPKAAPSKDETTSAIAAVQTSVGDDEITAEEAPKIVNMILKDLWKATSCGDVTERKCRKTNGQISKQ
jgi:hypothetical protein